MTDTEKVTVSVIGRATVTLRVAATVRVTVRVLVTEGILDNTHEVILDNSCLNNKDSTVGQKYRTVNSMAKVRLRVPVTVHVKVTEIVRARESVRVT